MSKPLGLLACSLLLPALAVTACGDDSSVGDDGGQAGIAGTAGSPPLDGAGGAAEGGQAGARADGVAGDGGTAGASTPGGNGGEGLGGGGLGGGGEGRAGEGGTGRGASGGAGGEGGGGGSGGGGDEGCDGPSLPNRLCGAFEARACDEPVDCVACAQQAKDQRAPFATCAACAAAFDSWQQCAVTAFEDGNVREGVECVGGYAEVHGDNCASYLQAAIDCSIVEGTEGCPATWPE